MAMVNSGLECGISEPWWIRRVTVKRSEIPPRVYGLKIRGMCWLADLGVSGLSQVFAARVCLSSMAFPRDSELVGGVRDLMASRTFRPSDVSAARPPAAARGAREAVDDAAAIHRAVLSSDNPAEAMARRRMQIATERERAVSLYAKAKP
ncbi:hypothetical protein [Nocardia sp. NPDC049707]|uniref:hypothetical protein n=1 Tax=Nocardia sp. NPDC049707 TaxID=3154735 RepID=UPI003417EA10